jgi:Domain of unknown function (DUF4129)
MSQQRSRIGGTRGGAVRGWGLGHLALTAALLAVVAVGLRGTVPAATFNGAYRHDGLPIAAAAEAVLACLLIALLIRRSRAPDDAVMAAQLRRLLTYIVVIALVAIPVAYVFDIEAHVHLSMRPPQPRHGSQRQGLPGAHPSGHLLGEPIVIILLVLVAAVAIYGLVRFIVAYRGTWNGWRRGAASAAIEPSADTGEADLLEVVESGRSALRLLDDARAAIIACYVAMEQALARAGTSRGAADTPDELLARAAGQGLVRTDAAARLTALFYEARFSSHPVPPTRRDDAQRALAELAASLTDPEPAAGAGSGRATGPAGAGG